MLGALFGFKGRLSLPGFWEVLASVVLVDAALLIGRMYVVDSGLPGGLGPQLNAGVLAWTPWIAAIFTVWVLIAAMVKRSHDRGRSATSVLWLMVPVIGWLWLFVDLFMLPSDQAREPDRPSARWRDPETRPAFNWGADPLPAAAVAMEPVHAHHDAPAHEPPAHEEHDGVSVPISHAPAIHDH